VTASAESVEQAWARLNADLAALDKTGDKVLYAKYAGTEFKIDDDELLILSERDVLALVND